MGACTLWYTLCVWVHTIAAAAWVGSMIFFAAEVVPILRKPGTALGHDVRARDEGRRAQRAVVAACPTLQPK